MTLAGKFGSFNCQNFDPHSCGAAGCQQAVGACRHRLIAVGLYRVLDDVRDQSIDEIRIVNTT